MNKIKISTGSAIMAYIFDILIVAAILGAYYLNFKYCGGAVILQLTLSILFFITLVKRGTRPDPIMKEGSFTWAVEQMEKGQIMNSGTPGVYYRITEESKDRGRLIEMTIKDQPLTWYPANIYNCDVTRLDWGIFGSN